MLRLLPAFLIFLQASCRSTPTYLADGRLPLHELYGRYRALAHQGWLKDTVYAYPGQDAPPILALRTARQGRALWILAGIHGEEPAGPNAVVRNLASLTAAAEAGIPVVLLPLCNPKGYRHNWRYPNTLERDWRKGGYSVGDAEYLLPDLGAGNAPRAATPAGPETAALTAYVLRLAQSYPPLLVLDLHEDELSKEGGYIYSQGSAAGRDSVGAEVARLLRSSAIPLRLSGATRFGEPIVAGVVSRDAQGLPLRDGSIDELLAARHVFRDGKKIAGPSAPTVIVVETPAFSGSNLDRRVQAHGAILSRVGELWALVIASLPGR